MERSRRVNFSSGGSGGGGKRGYGVKNPVENLFGEDISDEETKPITKNKHKSGRAIKNSGKFSDKKATESANVSSVDHDNKRGFVKSTKLTNTTTTLYTNATRMSLSSGNTSKRKYESHAELKDLNTSEYDNADMTLKINEGHTDFSNETIGGYINDSNVGYFNVEPIRRVKSNNDENTFSNVCDKDDITKYVGTSFTNKEGAVGYPNVDTFSYINQGSTTDAENDKKGYKQPNDTQNAAKIHEKNISKYTGKDNGHKLYENNNSSDYSNTSDPLFEDVISPENIGKVSSKYQIDSEGKVGFATTVTNKYSFPNPNGQGSSGNTITGEGASGNRNDETTIYTTVTKVVYDWRFEADRNDRQMGGQIEIQECDEDSVKSGYQDVDKDGGQGDANDSDHDDGQDVGNERQGQVYGYFNRQNWWNSTQRDVVCIEYFINYLKVTENAYVTQQGLILSDHLSLWDSHIFIIQYMKNYDQYINRICTISELKLVITSHVDSVKAMLARKLSLAFERQLACTLFVINLLHAPYHRNESWTLNLLVAVAKDLRIVAEKAALERSPADVDATILETAADALLYCFRVCSGAKESGLPYINAELMSIFCALKQVNVSRPIMHNMHESSFTRFFKLAQDNLCKYYFEPYGFYQRFPYAYDFFNYAFENCHQTLTEYKLHLLIRLTPLMLAKNILPSRTVLQAFNLTLFADLSDAMAIGNVDRFDTILNSQTDFFFDHGLFNFTYQHVRYNALRNAYQRYFVNPNYTEVAVFQAAVQILPQGTSDGVNYITVYYSHGTIIMMFNGQQRNMIIFGQIPNANPSLNQNN